MPHDADSRPHEAANRTADKGVSTRPKRDGRCDHHQDDDRDRLDGETAPRDDARRRAAPRLSGRNHHVEPMEAALTIPESCAGEGTRAALLASHSPEAGVACLVRAVSA